ncbi:MAG: hypothetical protein M1607_02995 [Patescibacteria group bacterium]|nr:hypothetical protein [Patescibacteria group bacterium]
MSCLLSKKLLLPALAVAILTIGVMGASVVNAQTPDNHLAGLVQAISQKFGLNESQVQAVVDQYQQQQKANFQANAQQRLTDRLNQAVTDGKITDTQKQAILDELAKLQSEYSPSSLKAMSADQRKQTLQQEQDEIQSWAQSQGIDPSYLRPGYFVKGGRGWFGEHSIGPSVTPTATPTPTQ